MKIKVSWVALLSFLSANVAFADITTIDFEGLADGTSVTNQYAGLLFSNTTILTAGVSLDAAEFPPHSGINVVFDDGGPISIVFSPDVLSFEAYFTYAEPLTATAYDDMGDPVDVATSLYSSNLAFSTTNPPNELISLSFAGGINEVTVAGDPGGSSFVMDDVTITTAATAVPDPSSIILFATVLFFVCFLERERVGAGRLKRQDFKGITKTF